ncbi:MAG: hypothetical protein Fur0039_01000 [Rhodocyclaceae bacterium]
MDHKAPTSRTVRYAVLVTVVTLTTAFAGAIALMVHLASNPEELELDRVAPWAAVGAAAGLLLWFVLNPDHYRRNRKHRKHRPRSEPRESAPAEPAGE